MIILASGQFWLLTASASGLIIENICTTNYSKLLTLQQTVVVYLVLGIRISISHARKEYWYHGKALLVVCWCESMVIRDYSPSAIFRNSRPVSHKSRSAGWNACSSIITLASDFSQITITLAWEQKEYENMTLSGLILINPLADSSSAQPCRRVSRREGMFTLNHSDPNKAEAFCSPVISALYLPCFYNVIQNPRLTKYLSFTRRMK